MHEFGNSHGAKLSHAIPTLIEDEYASLSQTVATEVPPFWPVVIGRMRRGPIFGCVQDLLLVRSRQGLRFRWLPLMERPYIIAQPTDHVPTMHSSREAGSVVKGQTVQESTDYVSFSPDLIHGPPQRIVGSNLLPLSLGSHSRSESLGRPAE
jgi:hypothetical protein